MTITPNALQMFMATIEALCLDELGRRPTWLAPDDSVGVILLSFAVNTSMPDGTVTSAETLRAWLHDQPEAVAHRAIPPVRPLPPPPARDQVCNGRTTQQGLMVTTKQFGAMPWWGACWAWLSHEDRALVAEQLLAHGDTICLIQLPDGVPLYDESGQFYSPDKFGPLDMTSGGTQIDPAFVVLIDEALRLGFQAVWVFLGGDDGGLLGFPVAVHQTRLLGPALATWPAGNLNDYVMQVPGWDGTWHAPQPGTGTGYSREQIAQFAVEARGAGARYVAIEQGTGYLLAGKGAEDYQPGGVVSGYDTILGEFDDGRFDDSVWQILDRMIEGFIRPPEMPASDDPRPPHDRAGTNKVYRVFEFGIYGAVRGTAPSTVAAWRAKFEALGATNVC